MARTRNNVRQAVDRTTGWVCAAWLIGAAGTTQAIAQSARSKDPFNAAAASSDQDKVHVSEHMTVDLHVNDEDLVNVLQMLSIQSERNIVASNKVSATVSADLYNVTFYEALDAILTVNGYGYIEKGNFIYVYTLEELQQIQQAQRRPVAKVIRLNYLNANDAAEFVSPLLSEAGQIKTNGDVDTFTIPDDAPVGDETFALEATLVVVDYPENVEEIEKLIEQLDTRPQQVLVEATILQTQINEANAFGVDFSIIGDLDFTDFINTGGPLSVASALQKGGTGSGNQGLSPADNAAIGLTSSAGSTDKPATLKLGIVQDDVAIFLRLLDEITDFTVLSNPKVLSLNRQPARVLVGAKIGFLNTTATQTTSTQTVQFLDTGTQLAFRPFVGKDGFIRMELRPSVSEGVIRQATSGNGGSVSIPDEITQEVTTNVIVRDGSTIVLGGLFKESTTVTRRQVPVIGDIPIIGAAFRGHDDSTERNEIIFLITPTIMNDNALLDQGKIAGDYVDAVRSGARRQLLPFSRDRMTAALNVDAERLAADGKTDKALWKLRRSLELNSNQPEALRMRERLMGKQDRDPSRSILRRIVEEAMHDEGAGAFIPAAPETPAAPSASEPKARPAADSAAPASSASANQAGAATAPKVASVADDSDNANDEPFDFNFDWPEADAGLDNINEPSSQAPANPEPAAPGNLDKPAPAAAPNESAEPNAPASANPPASEPGGESDFMRFPSASDSSPSPAPESVSAAPSPDAAQPTPSKSLLDDLISKAAERSAREKSAPGATQAQAASASTFVGPPEPPARSAPKTAGADESADWFDLLEPPAAESAPATPDAAPNPSVVPPAPVEKSAPKPASQQSSRAPRAGAAGEPPAFGPFPPADFATKPIAPPAGEQARANPTRLTPPARFAPPAPTLKTATSDGDSTPRRLPTMNPADFGRATSDNSPAFSRLAPPPAGEPNPGERVVTRPTFPRGDASVNNALTRTGRSDLEPPKYFDPFTHLPNDPFDWERSLAEVESLAKQRREEMRLVSPWEVKSLPSQWMGPAWIFDPMFPYLSWSLAPGAPFFLPADPKQWPEGLTAPGLFPTLKGTWKQVQGPLQSPDQRDDIEETSKSARITEVAPEPDDDNPKR